MSINEDDLIFHSKWRSPGQFASGTATVSVTSRSLANNTSYTYETVIPFDSSLFATCLVYYQPLSPSVAGYWTTTPDTFSTGAPDGLPVNVAGAIEGSNMKIRVTYRNTFGGSVTIAARTFNFKYFLFV